MREEAGHSPRLLFVVSDDFGELAKALTFTVGTSLQPRLLLPERLFAANRESLTHPVACYRTTYDIVEAVERERPDLIGLFSGYLYALNGFFTLDDVEALVRGLQGRGVRLLVSDPFLGALARLDDSTFSDRHPRKAWLTEHFARLVRVFAGVPHLYPVPVDGVKRPRGVSFFNPSIVARRREIVGDLSRRIAADPGRPRWLFVLSTEDYGCQVGLHERARFGEMLRDMLRQSVRAGRQPLLVAPRACAEALERADPPIRGLAVLPPCDHATFLACLLEAEYAFYWNAYAGSIPIRVANSLPVFLFDAGHLVRTIPSLGGAGAEWLFRDAELRLLGSAADLSPERLAPLAARQVEMLEGARAHYRRAPPPEELLAALTAE